MNTLTLEMRPLSAPSEKKRMRLTRLIPGGALPLLTMIGLAIIAAPVPTFAAGCAAAEEGQGFANKSLESIETSAFVVEFDSTPTALGESFVGISDGSQNVDNYAVLIRFNQDGFIDAKNGGEFAAAAKVPFSAGVMYHFTVHVDVGAHKYTVFVTPPLSMTPPKGNKLLLGRNFSFQPSQNNVFDLNAIGVGRSGEGSINACNVAVASVRGGGAPVTGAQIIPFNMDCTLILPADPLSAAGLSTPFQLMSADPMQICDEASSANGAFAGGAIYDPAAHTISVFNPLVINAGTSPAIAPTPPTLPAGAVVALWFGYDGNNLLLQGPAAPANCVNGDSTTLFTQFSYCNAVAFFTAVHADATLMASIPALGISPKNNHTCPSPRDFAVVDQDQSDNLPTEYLLVTGPALSPMLGLLAQNTLANRTTIGAGNFKVIANPSDERLTAKALGPALGCGDALNPTIGAWKVADLADGNNPVPSLPTNELQSGKFGPSPVALIPANDPMAQNGGSNLIKINLYRAGVDQPAAATLADADPTAYCRNFRTITGPRVLADKPYTVVANSPVATTGNSLFTFLAARYVAAYSILGCPTLLGQPVPIILTLDSNGVAINARGLTR